MNAIVHGFGCETIDNKSRHWLSFLYNKNMTQDTQKLRGVNLGGWLVLEKWMTPSLFAGTDAVDEYTFMRTEGAAAKLTRHWDTFITEEDFAWLQAQGINAVRLPIGFWAIEPHGQLMEATTYIDWTLEMGKKYNLQVLLCLHGAYGSQNGQDHSGKTGPLRWYRGGHRQATQRCLQKLAARYGQDEALWGIELLNEPLRLYWWRTLLLKRWTRRTMTVLSRQLPARCKLVYSDAFRPDAWTGKMNYVQAVMDVHHYQCFSDEDKKLPIAGHVKKVRAIQVRIQRWQHDQPVIIGEWSLGLDGASLHGDNRQQAERQFAKAQLEAFSAAAGWFFWNYKTEQSGGWNFRYLVENGFFTALTDQR